MNNKVKPTFECNTPLPELERAGAVELPSGQWFKVKKEVPYPNLNRSLKLIIGIYGDESRMTILPQRAGEEAFLEENGSFYKIQFLNDLKGDVTITNSTDALAFVRLASSQALFGMVSLTSNIVGVEVMRASDAKKMPGYLGDEIGLLDLTSPGRNGILPDAVYNGLHIHPASCTRRGNGFVVDRLLVVDSTYYLPDEHEPPQILFVRVTESVGRNGAYHILNAHIVSEPLHWSLPRF